MSKESGHLGSSDFEVNDYTGYWTERTLDDLAHKHIVRGWLPRGRACVELGGGFGRLTAQLCNAYPEVTMIELGRKNLGIARKAVPMASLVRGDASKIPLRSDYFDCAVAVRVIHLLPDPAFFLREVERVVKDGATVILSVPNLMMYNIMWFAKGFLLPASLRGRHPTYGSPVWPSGTRPNLSPASRYIPRSFKLEARRGTGLLDNYLGRMLRAHRRLYLADVATSGVWFLKFDTFLRFRVRKP